MLRALTILALLGLSVKVYAAEYRCKVEKKLNFENAYSQSQIEKSRFSVLGWKKKQVPLLCPAVHFLRAFRKSLAIVTNSTKSYLTKTRR